MISGLLKIIRPIFHLRRPMPDIIEEIRKIEFERIDYQTFSDDYFGIMKGKIPILISAPHGARHLRPTFEKPEKTPGKPTIDAVWKEEDEYTSAIAVKLGELTGAHVIYVKNKTIEDPNLEKGCKYKLALKRLIKGYGIKFVADIHGIDIARNHKLSVGIIDEKDMTKCSCPNLKPVIEAPLKHLQHPLFNLEGFKAEGKSTVTYFASKICKTEDAQFEIRADFRIIERKADSSKAISLPDPDWMCKAKPKEVLEMVKALETMINAINQTIGNP